MTITGSGTSGNPYVIYTFSDLELLGTSPYTLDKHYRLANDIDASPTSDPGYNSGQGWQPRGTLTGVFNGNGYRIFNLYINRPTTNNVALFSATGQYSGNIINLTLVNADITGQDTVSGFVGWMGTQVPYNLEFRGEINGRDEVAGIIAHKYDGGFNNLRSYGTINSTGNTTAGIVGYSYSGNVYNCYSEMTINSTGNYVGGIVGWTKDSASLTTWNCEFAGIINASSGSLIGAIGGFFGNGTISYCKFVNGEINASNSDSVGGLVGQKYTGNITKCTVSAPITGKNNVGGLVGYTTGLGYVNYCTVSSTITGVSNIGGTLGYANNLTGHDISNFTFNGNIIATGSYVGFVVGSSGSGTIHDIIITEGTMTVSETTDYVGGIVGFSYSTTLTNLLVIKNITGRDYVGGICGFLQDADTYTKCAFIGNINGRNYVGGISGSGYLNSTETMNYCYSYGNITASGNYAGGLSGYVRANFNNSFSRANVSGVNHVGGFLGRYEAGTITNCYSTGSIEGTSDIGGFIGSRNTGLTQTVNNSYFDRETSGTSVSALGNPRFSSEMHRTSNYFSWDFSAVWYLGDDYNDSYPLLRDNNLGFIDYIDATSDIISEIYVPYTSDVLSRVCVLAIKSDILSRVIARAAGLDEISSKVFVNNKIYRTELSDINSQVTVNSGATAKDVYSLVVVNGLISKTIEISGTIVYDHYNSNLGSNPNFGVMFGGVYID